MPNEQNYWIEAGHEEEMLAIRQAIANRVSEKLPHLMTERWLRDVTLYGSVTEVREGSAAWCRREDPYRGAIVSAGQPDGGSPGTLRRVAVRSAFAFRRSGVAKPSVNQPWISASNCRASSCLPRACQS